MLTIDLRTHRATVRRLAHGRPIGLFAASGCCLAAATRYIDLHNDHCHFGANKWFLIR